MTAGPEIVHLGNWREAPHNRWAFSHVRELIPTANIAADRQAAKPLSRQKFDLTDESFRLRDGRILSLAEFLDSTSTDGFMVVKRGAVIAEWWRSEEVRRNPHIVFSVSKSITAMLAGISRCGGNPRSRSTDRALCARSRGLGLRRCDRPPPSRHDR